jgi:hypothetical protein
MPRYLRRSSGRVNVWAARQGEVVAMGATIVTIMDLTQTWVYAPLPETQGDAVQLGDILRVVMPSGKTVYGKVINKAAEADFATQRDVSSRKRDIKTIQLKLLIDNPGERVCPRHDGPGLHSQRQAGEAVSAAQIQSAAADSDTSIKVETRRQALR